ncbi:MAG: hypothetical protein SOZ62_01295 [Eubacteriales bacterium]|nr:hypothetical protein [Eubacteriales bacterium]
MMKGISKKTKIVIIAVCALLLAAAITVTSFLVYYRRHTVMKYGSYRVTEDMYEYWYSTYKYQILRTYPQAKDTAAFWSSDNGSGQTYEQYFSDVIDGYIKEKLVASVLFDGMGYTLSSAAREEISSELSEMLEAVGDGDKDKFNETAKKYGIDYDGYKNVAVFNYKATYLFHILYGADGSKVSDEEANRFYNENYSRVRIVVIRKNDDYLRGTDSQPIISEDGKYVMNKYDDAKIAEIAALIERMKGEVDSNSMSEEKFLGYFEVENRDFKAGKYEGGYYLSRYSNYDKDIIYLSQKMNVGDIAYVDKDDYTIFMKKYENEEKAYASYEYKDSEWFDSFYKHAAESAYSELLRAEFDNIKVYDDVKEKIKLSKVRYNWEI